jgi:hypothetical protein
MFLDNESEVEDRIAYYGINGVPAGTIAGENIADDCGFYEGAPACLDEDDINAVYDVISPFTMTVEAGAEGTTLVVSGSIYADAAQDGDLRLRVALLEKIITIEDAPGGTNGETEYHHVMKKFLGDGTDGTMLDAFMMGDSYDFEFTLELGTVNIYNYGQLEVAAWVQDDDTKAVYQAAKAESVDFVVDVDNNAGIPSIDGLPASICSGTATITPMVKLMNTGNDDLMSCDIVYSVNGGTEQTYNWTGDLSTFDAEWVELDPITFDAPAGDSQVDFMVTNPNGMVDEDMSDDSNSATIAVAPGTVQHLEIQIDTDIYADEIYWEVRGSNGDVIDWGGNPNVGTDNIGTLTFPPPADPAMYLNNTSNMEYVTLPAGEDCYTFHITDYYGDGILAPGGYALRDNEGNVILEDFTNDTYVVENTQDFSATSNGISVDDITLNPHMTVSPNPATDVLNVSVTSMVQSAVTLEIVNAQGQLVSTQYFSNQSKDFNTQINVSDLAEGLYFLNLVHENGSETSKVIIRK